MSKYIIKNCPCLFDAYYASGKTVKFECNDGNHEDKLCCDVTDCLLKRIVELCKKEWDLRPDMNIDDNFPREVLQLLEIEEV